MRVSPVISVAPGHLHLIAGEDIPSGAGHITNKIAAAPDNCVTTRQIADGGG